jgi:hypothetical protein
MGHLAFTAIRGWSASAPSGRGPLTIDELAEQHGKRCPSLTTLNIVCR